MTSTTTSVAFLTPAPQYLLRCHQYHNNHPSSTLFQTVDNDDGSSFGTDELAKLRKKREEIMAKKKAQAELRTKPQSIPDVPPEQAITSDDVTGDESTPTSSSWSSTETPSDDLETLLPPTLPPRPSVMGRAARRRAQEERSSSSSSSSRKKKDDESGGPRPIDYLADYDDENELHIPNRIGFGTARWGDVNKGFVAEGRLKKKQVEEGKFLPGDLQVAYNTLLNNGISFIDTSESYGISSRPSSLSAEHMLGRFAEENLNNSPLLATKFANPYTNFLNHPRIRVGGNAVLNAASESCARLETSGVELYQIQSTFLYGGGAGALADGLARALDRGLANHVGLCHASPRKMKHFQRLMDRRGFSLSSNQFAFSLTHRRALKDGTLAACKDLGIVPIAHTPLDGGLASGKYTANNPSGGTMGRVRYDFKKVLEPLIPLHEAQLRVAGKVKERLKKEWQDEKDMRLRKSLRYGPGNDFNREVTPAQVAINYVVAKGAVPIPGIKNNKEAEELLGCLGWGLNEEEVAILDQAADLCKR